MLRHRAVVDTVRHRSITGFDFPLKVAILASSALGRQVSPTASSAIFGLSRRPTGCSVHHRNGHEPGGHCSHMPHILRAPTRC